MTDLPGVDPFFDVATNEAGFTGFWTVGIVFKLFSQTLVPLLTVGIGAGGAVTTFELDEDLTGGKLFLGNMLRISASGSLISVDIKL